MHHRRSSRRSVQTGKLLCDVCCLCLRLCCLFFVSFSSLHSFVLISLCVLPPSSLLHSPLAHLFADSILPELTLKSVPLAGRTCGELQHNTRRAVFIHSSWVHGSLFQTFVFGDFTWPLDSSVDSHTGNSFDGEWSLTKDRRQTSSRVGSNQPLPPASPLVGTRARCCVGGEDARWMEESNMCLAERILPRWHVTCPKRPIHPVVVQRVECAHPRL
jgi:hypothetical protein